MKIIEIISVIEQFAPPGLQEDYDNAGLIAGNSSQPCTGVLCCLDITMEIIREAKENKCNLILAHHPIIFRSLKKINGKNYVEQVVIEAIRNDIALYAAHTNLDNVQKGVNGMIAGKLGLKNASILQPKRRTLRKLVNFAPLNKAEELTQVLFNAGAGHIGNYSECSFSSEGTGTFKATEGADPYVGKIGQRHYEKEAKIEVVYPFYLEEQVLRALVDNHPYEEVAYDIFTMENSFSGVGAGMIGELEAPVNEKEFLKFIKDSFRAEGIRHTRLLGKPVKKIAVCGGAGSFLIKRALEAGADMYITSDVKYHEFFDAEDQMVIADLGHYESEQFTIDLIHDLLVEKFTTFAVLKTKVNTNPVRYF